jgi:ankyrin repeat protein
MQAECNPEASTRPWSQNQLCCETAPAKLNDASGNGRVLGEDEGRASIARRRGSIDLTGAQGTVLNIATRFKEMGVARVMLQDYGSIFRQPSVINGMDGDAHTPLEGAALGGPSLIDLVLEAGAYIDFRDPSELESGTALATTICYNRFDSAIYLLEKGASVFCRGAPHEQMWSFLNELIYHCGVDHDLRPKYAGFLQSSRKWIEKHNLLSVRNWAGQTILQSAVHHGQLAAVKALAEFGASVHDRLHAVRLPYWNATNHFWDEYDVEGLDIVSFARVLRNSTPKQKDVWKAFIPFEITTDNMDEIIDYLVEVRGHDSSPASIHRRQKWAGGKHSSRRKHVRFLWSDSAT